MVAVSSAFSVCVGNLTCTTSTYCFVPYLIPGLEYDHAHYFLDKWPSISTSIRRSLEHGWPYNPISLEHGPPYTQFWDMAFDVAASQIQHSPNHRERHPST